MSAVAVAERLAALAAGLCQDAGIRVEVVASGWAWDPIRRVILIPGPELEVRGPEYCAGILAHEVSHYYISRYVWFTMPFPSLSILRFLLNAIEDPRVNTWIKRRYPGATVWMARVSDEDMRKPNRNPMPAVLRFGFEAAREEWIDWVPAQSLGGVPDEVAQALDETRTARRTFAETLPPRDLAITAAGPELARRYREEVWPRLNHVAPRSLPPPREQAIRVSVMESLQIAERDVLPVALRLLENDVLRTASLLAESVGIRRAAQQALREFDAPTVRGLLAEAAQRPTPTSFTPPPGFRELALELIEAWLSDWRGSRQGHGEPLLDPEDHPPSDEPIPPPRRLPPPRTLAPPTDAYDKALSQIAPQIERLTQTIERLIRPSRRLRDRAGYASGYKVDLRRLLAFDADPREYDRLWVRKNVPHRGSVVFSLLVDLSGSMRGAKCDAALAGSVLLAETLHRLQVPFAVNGFQDVLIPFCDFAEGLTAWTRRLLGEMPLEVAGSRPGGNNKPSWNDDGPCLLEAAEELLNQTQRQRILVVISDGWPEGTRSDKDDLHRAVSQLRRIGPALRLVAIGLGPGTDHVTKFYPESLANVPLEQLAEQIGMLLSQALVEGYR